MNNLVNRLILMVVTSIGILPLSLPAQAVAQVSEVNSISPVQSALDARISVNLKDVTVERAIAAIGRQANLKIVVGGSVRALSKSVTLNANGIAANEAFKEVLRGTDVRMSVTRSGQVIFDRPEGRTINRGQGVITGKVTDNKTGKGISGATISVNNDMKGIGTEEGGVYRLMGVAEGNHTVTVRLVGYAKQTRQVVVGEGATVTADFRLEPSANVLDQVIVTGTVVQTELRSVPNAITVVTAKDIEQRGIIRIDQLFRGDIPGLFAPNLGSNAQLDEVTMFSRGATGLTNSSAGMSEPIAGVPVLSNTIKTYVDGVEMADSKYLSQIDPRSIERIEILSGPQASTIYGSNAINGVMQIFTKRGTTARPQLTLSLLSGLLQNNFSSALTPQHNFSGQISGVEGKLSYNTGGSWDYTGQWTPGKQLSRVGGFGGARIDIPTSAGNISADITGRRSATRSMQRGSPSQADTYLRESGLWTATGTIGLAQLTTRSLKGQTFGFQVSYAPTAWWSHELGMGSDVSESERAGTGPGLVSPSDTLLRLDQTHADRRSMHYSTTVRVPVASFSQFTITAGADNWQSLTTSMASSPAALTGTLSSITSLSRRPAHNTGGFAQGQLGIMDQLFFTYGLRLEKNPTIGDKARVVPGRYGVAYTHEIGDLTTKLRASYGSSIRPPVATRKDAVPQTSATLLPLYGPHNIILANPELTPEYQKGGEGGVELYLGTRATVVVTRYNQTVDNLVTNVSRVDSVRTIDPCPGTDASCFASSSSRDAEGRAFRYQNQYLNIGSIRNQGWELQSSMNMGPFTTRGTYSWTKSRVIGVTEKYRRFFATNASYQPGASFQSLAEHAWALGLTYSHAQSSVALNFTGLGRTTNALDDFFNENLSSTIRLPQDRLNVSGVGYVTFNLPYALADLSVSHRFSSRVEALLQVQNLGDNYTNDYWASYATLGRQVKFGARVRTN